MCNTGLKPIFPTFFFSVFFVLKKKGGYTESDLRVIIRISGLVHLFFRLSLQWKTKSARPFGNFADWRTPPGPRKGEGGEGEKRKDVVG